MTITLNNFWPLGAAEQAVKRGSYIHMLGSPIPSSFCKSECPWEGH